MIDWSNLVFCHLGLLVNVVIFFSSCVIKPIFELSMKLPIKINLPEHFLEGELRNGYYVTPEIKKLWAVEIDILFQIKEICDRHNIKWFVEGGTLLGAVRHKGFIPWDDDIDIDMFREDYERFIFFAKQELKAPYFLQTHETDSLSMYGHAKVRNSQTMSMQVFEHENQLDYNQGIFVDIFPLDKAPDTLEEASRYADLVRKQFCLSRDRLYDSLCFKTFPLRKNLLKLLNRYIICYGRKLLYKIKGCKYINEVYSVYETMCISYNNSEFHHFNVYALPFNPHSYWPAEIFEGRIEMITFEWFSVPSIMKKEDYLYQLYGDWQKFVIGTSLHGELIYDTEHSYKTYLNDAR